MRRALLVMAFMGLLLVGGLIMGAALAQAPPVVAAMVAIVPVAVGTTLTMSPWEAAARWFVSFVMRPLGRRLAVARPVTFSRRSLNHKGVMSGFGRCSPGAGILSV